MAKLFMKKTDDIPMDKMAPKAAPKFGLMKAKTLKPAAPSKNLMQRLTGK